MNLIGKVKLINSKTNKCEHIYSYEYLNENKSIRVQLKEKLDSGNYRLLCGCNNHELKININFVIYLAKQNTKNLHHNYCPKSEIYETWTKKYNTGWKEEEGSDEIEVKLKFSLNPKNKRVYEIESNPLRKKTFSCSDEIEGKISLLSLATHLNLITWKKILARDNKLIMSKNEYLGYIYGMAKNIKISGKDKTLQDIMFNYANDKDLPSNECRFIYGYIENKTEFIQCNDKFNLDIVHIKDKNSFNFKIDKELYNKALNYPKMKDDSLSKINKYFMVAGLVVRNKYKQFELIDFVIFNTTKQGLFCESVPEIKFYTRLIVNGIKFYKPYKRMIEYDGHIPDGIIELENKTIFIEVFGFDSPEYLKTKEEKLNIMERLKDTHSIMKWDVLNESMPTIEDIKMILNEN